LGNNWGGKSNLLLAWYTLWNDYNMLYSHRDIKFTYKHKKWEGLLDIKNNITNNDGQRQIASWEHFETYTILDDFFKLSWNSKISINKEILNKENLNTFYFNIHDFLNSENWNNFKQIFESYFKIKDINTSIFIASKKISQDVNINTIMTQTPDLIKSSLATSSECLKYLLFTSFYYYCKNIIKILDWVFIQKNKKNYHNAQNEIRNYQKNLFNSFSKFMTCYLNNRINIDDYKIILEKNWFLENFISEFLSSKFTTDYNKISILYHQLDKISKDTFKTISYLKLNSNNINLNKLNKENRKVLDYYFMLDLKFNELSSNLTFENLSAWEKCLLLRFTNIYKNIYDEFLLFKIIWNNWNNKLVTRNFNNNFLVLIDEPDLHLHLDWQRQYIQKLIDVFSTLDPEISLHFIIATHSPFIISDLPQKSLVLLENWKQIEYEWETFWANYIDIIKNGFFFEKKQMLMWSFAQNIIWDIAENERQNITNNQDLHENHEEIKNNIWDEFLKDNLLYFKPEKND
jgi:hypothetical protein